MDNTKNQMQHSMDAIPTSSISAIISHVIFLLPSISMTQSVFPIYNYFCDTYIVSNVRPLQKGNSYFQFPHVTKFVLCYL